MRRATSARALRARVPSAPATPSQKKVRQPSGRAS
jgi:hypothetical protein